MIERLSLGVLSNPESSSILGGFIRWDAGHYERIFAHGYTPSTWWDTAFLPLYPYTVRGLADLGNLRFDQAAVAVSWAALWLACWGVIRFTADVFPEAKAWRAGMLLAFFPASVFLLSGYAESLFIALAAWTFVALAERRVWIAAGLCALASATRPEGAILALAVAIWVLIEGIKRQQHRDPHSALGLAFRSVSLGLLSVSGLVAYSLFLWNRFHHPLEAFSSQRVWKRAETWPFHPVFSSLQQVLDHRIRGATAGKTYGAYLFNDGVVIFAIIVLAVLVRMAWRQRDLLWFVIPSVAILLLVVSNAPYGKDPSGYGRVIMCIVPLYAVTAKARSEVGWTALFAGSAASAAIFQAIFNTNGWLT
jgi:hypothetical protein